MWRWLIIAKALSALTGAAELQVAAAADLAGVQPALGAAFSSRNTRATVRWITGSSGVLAKQAENGAPFDVFLSASESYVLELVSKGVAVRETTVVYATGRVGLWSLSGSVRSLDDLSKPGVLHVAIANPAHAPYGMAAKEALESRGVWAKLAGKMVYGENVRQALQFAESGNADAVLTAWSLVRSKPGAVELPPKGSYKPLRQAGVVLKSSREAKAAGEFLRFLMSAEARKILRDAGFGAVE